MRRFSGRLHTLEIRVAEEQAQGRTHVICVGPDGRYEAGPDAMGPHDRVIALPRKAPSVAVWHAWCALLLADRQDWDQPQLAEGETQ
jgi:hypothetical protein